MGSADEPSAHRKRRDNHPLDPECFEAGQGPADIDDGIDATNFVEVNLVDGGIVNRGLHFADAGEDPDGRFLDRIG